MQVRGTKKERSRKPRQKQVCIVHHSEHCIRALLENCQFRAHCPILGYCDIELVCQLLSERGQGTCLEKAVMENDGCVLRQS